MKARLATLADSPDSAVDVVKAAVRACKAWEIEHFDHSEDHFNPSESHDPSDSAFRLRDTMSHITTILNDFILEEKSPKLTLAGIKKLKKLTKQGQETAFSCPCCKREMNPDESVVFSQEIDKLTNINTSPVLSTVENMANKNYYESKIITNLRSWREDIENNADGFREWTKVSEDLVEDSKRSLRLRRLVLSRLRARVKRRG
jgi:hypothetical protein